MEDQKFIYYLHTKTYCTSNNQNQKKKKKKEKEKREKKEKILYWRLTCSLYRINLLEIDLSVVQVMSEWTWLIQFSVLTKAMFDFLNTVHFNK